MNTLLRITALLLIIGVSVAVAPSKPATFAKHQATQAQPAQSSDVQVIDMTAKKYVFNPSPIHVKKGTKVQLRITSTDHTHGFKINLYPDGGNTKGAPGLEFTAPEDCWKLPKGQTVTIEFVAKAPGHYPFKCCKFCGFGHMGMKGELIVDE